MSFGLMSPDPLLFLLASFELGGLRVCMISFQQDDGCNVTGYGLVMME